MRMWMVKPKYMCRKHLLGEHVELHMLVGHLKRGKSITGFVAKGLLQPVCIDTRHEELTEEMRMRGYNHKSPMPVDWEELKKIIRHIPTEERLAKVDVKKSLNDLLARCPECRERYRARKGQ